MGLHYEMEIVLTSRIRAMRQGSVVVEIWMTKEDGKAMLQELHAKNFQNKAQPNFNSSSAMHRAMPSLNGINSHLA